MGDPEGLRGSRAEGPSSGRVARRGEAPGTRARGLRPEGIGMAGASGRKGGARPSSVAGVRPGLAPFGKASSREGTKAPARLPGPTFGAMRRLPSNSHDLTRANFYPGRPLRGGQRRRRGGCRPASTTPFASSLRIGAGGSAGDCNSANVPRLCATQFQGRTGPRSAGARKTFVGRSRR